MLFHQGKYVCPNCFEIFETDLAACPICGYAGQDMGLVPVALPIGTILHGKYMVGHVLGKGGFGITYLGYDLAACQKVAIKEYLPDVLSYRSTGNTFVSSFGGDKESAYRMGAEKFYEEAKTVSRFSGHPNIVHVSEFFYENNTAYFSMEYVQGSDLKAYVETHGGSLSEHDTLRFLLPVMDALIVVHGTGVLHRDVSPDNIFLSESGTSKLLDFGSARQVLGEQSKSLSVVLKHGFAPIEQYQTRGKQGPWTDVYALGATMYYCLTGHIPEPAMDRIEEDALLSPSRLGANVTPRIEAALIKALAVKAANRFQTVAELKQALPLERFYAPQSASHTEKEEPPKKDAPPAAPFLAKDEAKPVSEGTAGELESLLEQQPNHAQKPPVHKKRRHAGLMSAAALAVLLIISFAAWRAMDGRFAFEENGASASAQAQSGAQGAEVGSASTQKTPQATASPAVQSTSTPSPTVSPTPVEQAATSSAATTAPTATPRPSASATAKPSATPKPTITATAEPEDTPPAATPKPAATPTTKPTATPNPATPKPTATARPTPIPTVDTSYSISTTSVSVGVGESATIYLTLPTSGGFSYNGRTGCSSQTIKNGDSVSIILTGATPGSYSLALKILDMYQRTVASETISITVTGTVEPTVEPTAEPTTEPTAQP